MGKTAVNKKLSELLMALQTDSGSYQTLHQGQHSRPLLPRPWVHKADGPVPRLDPPVWKCHSPLTHAQKGGSVLSTTNSLIMWP